MTTRLFRFLLPLALALVGAIASVALAGERLEKDSVATRGDNPVACLEDGNTGKGTAKYRFEHGGSTFLLAYKPTSMSLMEAGPRGGRGWYG
jgi:hypothetical protein